jgi:hypothetical protein
MENEKLIALILFNTAVISVAVAILLLDKKSQKSRKRKKY